MQLREAKQLVRRIPEMSIDEGFRWTAAKIADDKGQAPYYALFTVETNSVRFRMDGTDPTASVGHKVDAGQNVEIHGKGNVARIKFIAVTADATVMASYGR